MSLRFIQRPCFRRLIHLFSISRQLHPFELRLSFRFLGQATWAGDFSVPAIPPSDWRGTGLQPHSKRATLTVSHPQNSASSCVTTMSTRVRTEVTAPFVGSIEASVPLRPNPLVRCLRLSRQPARRGGGTPARFKQTTPCTRTLRLGNAFADEPPARRSHRRSPRAAISHRTRLLAYVRETTYRT